MRMWMLPPSIMCRKHLLGEHVEMHMLVGTLLKGISVQGYIDNQLVELEHIRARHDELVEEMIKRGYNHKSPLPDYPEVSGGVVDREENLRDLANRCHDCRERIENEG